MATAIINTQMDAINESFSNISSDLTTIRPLLKNATIGAYPTDTASGSIASFTDGAEGIPVKSLSVAIEPVQSGSGDPSPTNIRPISGHTEVNVYRTGKNLYDIGALVTKAWNGTSNYPTRARTETALWLPIGTTITISASSDFVATYNWNVVQANMDFPMSASISDLGWQTATTRTLTTVAPYIGITIKRRDSGTITLEDLQAQQFQIELGSTATDYEPYAGQTYNVSLGQTVYGGTLDVVSGVLTINTEFRTILGENVVAVSSATGYAMIALGALGYINAYYAARSNMFAKWDGTSSAIPANYFNCINSSDYNRAQLLFRCDFTSSSGPEQKQKYVDFLDEMNEAGTPLVVVYGLATPLTYQLTPTQVSTLLGENNVWSDAGTVAVTYRADTGLYIDKMIANAMNA